ncbi:acid phosphatase/Vanadium-dependent haloperoxidase [Lepidopterella palustris CBS 459.81]|uniref:Acid phosphatase/Vanadium-dependent haloperoxidase n=1 Tax=Lepidopterella palustris CBS 459.81 TaxID=1314670 RepID=A0A8E2E5Q6_9PEZI|nr:acid phosphatase/Vanadium-dependent haloperoxidase [Lepidopterella palustris CBS 459.81]
MEGTADGDGPDSIRTPSEPSRSYRRFFPYWWVDTPKFAKWWTASWPDLLVTTLCCVAGLIIMQAPPLTQRMFPVTFNNGNVVYPLDAYPRVTEIIPTWQSGIICFFVPFFFILFTSMVFVRGFWDMHNAMTGLSSALAITSLFQVFIKWLIGGFRPHFLRTCNPVMPSTYRPGFGLQTIWVDRTICTGNPGDVLEAMRSFPSGHSSAAFAGFIFLALYINAKYTTRSVSLRLAYVATPILIATLLAAIKTTDYYHYWYDTVGGAIIGTLFAFGAFYLFLHAEGA